MLQSWTRIALDWAYRCFGSKHVNDPYVRALRLLEEAAEYAQACGVLSEAAGEVLSHVYSRPKGEPFQELGGVFLTAVVAAGARGWLPEGVIEAELRRVLAKPAEHFTARNQEKVDAGLT